VRDRFRVILDDVLEQREVGAVDHSITELDAEGVSRKVKLHRRPT